MSVNRLLSDRLSDEDNTDDESSSKVSDAWSMSIPKWTKDDMTKSGIVEESSFATLFPKYREKYLKECWLLVQKKLDYYGVVAELDCYEGSITVATTKKMWDPYIIIKARDMVKLLARSAPYEHAVKVLEDQYASEIIKIRGLVRNREKFIKRRQRLVGPNGSTLKALELLTDCSLFVQGNTVSAIGTHRGLKEVARVIRDTMKNIHPIYNIKALMIKKELAKDPKMVDEDWSRFIPKFSQKNIKKAKKKIKPKKEYTPFPPPQEERKEDIEMASGEYFLKTEEKAHKKFVKKLEKQKEVKRVRDEEKAKSYIAPTEGKAKKKKTDATKDESFDLQKFKQKIKKVKKLK